jgi:hypothetical protein
MIGLIIEIVILGVVIYAVTTLIPMAPNFARLIQILGIIVALLLIASAFGVMPNGWHSDTRLR